MTIRSFPAIFNQTVGQPDVTKTPLRKAVAFAAGLGLSMLSSPLHAAPAGAAIQCRVSMTRYSVR